MFSSEIWRSVASNHYLELGQILNGAQINLLPGERVLRISITNLLIFHVQTPYVKEVFSCGHRRENAACSTHSHLFMLSDTRWHRHLQKSKHRHISRLEILRVQERMCSYSKRKLFNSETCCAPNTEHFSPFIFH